MKNLTRFLERYAEENQISFKDLAKDMQVHSSLLSKIKNGSLNTLSHETLTNMQKGVATKEQSNLLVAYLQDQIIGPGGKGIRIKSNFLPGSLEKEITSYLTELSEKELTCLLLLIKKMKSNSKMRAFLLGLAELRLDSPYS